MRKMAEKAGDGMSIELLRRGPLSINDLIYLNWAVIKSLVIGKSLPGGIVSAKS